MTALNPIVLMTDFGLQDPYVGLVKGIISGIAPGAPILDLTHHVPPQDILQGAFFLQNSTSYFPNGSIFLCVVDPGVGTSRKMIAVKTADYFFIAPDNGLLAPVLRVFAPLMIREITAKKYFRSPQPSATFHGRDIMAPVAAHLAKSRGRLFNQLGKKLLRYRRLTIPQPTSQKGKLVGEVLYFDRFGNAVTNISRAHLAQAVWERARIRLPGHRPQRLASCYHSRAAAFLFLLNSSHYLEIACPGASAYKKLKIHAGQKVEVLTG